MRRHRLLCGTSVLGLVLCFAIHGGAAAQSEPQEASKQAAPSRETETSDASGPPSGEPAKRVAAADPGMDYQPPRRGAPRAKLGGGLRFAAVGSRVTLHALAPDHVAHTRSKSPLLYWFVDPLPDSGWSIVFTIIDETSIEPVAEVRVPRPERAGIQAVDLAALGVELAPGVEYEWSIAVVVDRIDRSRGYIRYVGGDPEIARVPGDATAAELASAGLWYDALESISAAIDADPDAPDLKAQRTALLDQAGFDVSER